MANGMIENYPARSILALERLIGVMLKKLREDRVNEHDPAAVEAWVTRHMYENKSWP